jgi:predicted enzyme related to lactoylglutathione lyase
MSSNPPPTYRHPAHGSPGYLQLPALDIARSLAFYQGVLGWRGELEYGSFEAPGLIGQWTTDLAPVASGGPVLWFCIDGLSALYSVVAHGGRVLTTPQLDQGERWLVEVADPAGNRLGLVAPVRVAAAQPMLAVRDVEASSRWYQQLLGLRSDHGGTEYERLLAGDTLVLQLHHRDVGHHHGSIVTDPAAPVGNGALVWFGEVGDFDGAVQRAQDLGATVLRPVHRNPPEADGNGPSHRELWLQDPDGYTVVIASPDGEAWSSDRSSQPG